MCSKLPPTVTARFLPALALTLALLLVACGDGPSDEVDESGADPDEPAELELQEPEDLGEPVELDDDVAAIVDGQEIARTTVQERLDTMAELPEVAEQLEGEEGDLIAQILQAQILQNLILHVIVAQGADEMGVEPTEADLEEIEQRAVDEFEGDREEFRETLADEGVTGSQLTQELLFSARVEGIRALLAEDITEEERQQSEDFGMDPADFALQEWLGERLATTEVEVDQQYGRWNPQTGEVRPIDLPGPAG